MDNYSEGQASSPMLDVIIVGAGISGINAAYRLQTSIPGATYTILEARDAIGGTWDLFKYPGFRSDSDLYTFGFAWRPWSEEKCIANGDSIRQYMRDSAASAGIDRKIQFHHTLISADWSSEQQAWTLIVNSPQGQKTLHSRFVILGTGYYDYQEALTSSINGIERFQGKTLHPQFWDEKYDYKDKSIIVIGSGSTAVTLIPSLAETAKHVTMLQRSPTYIAALPAVDPAAAFLTRWLPYRLAHSIARFKFLVVNLIFHKLCMWYPDTIRKVLKKATMEQLPARVPHSPHFEPRYNPWEQRLCVCPDGDFFKAMRDGKADVVTATIDTVTETGIRLTSGQTLPADAIVTATGLKLKIAGGARITVDKQPITIGEKYLWKGVMLEDVPNLANVMGYTTASWTLGADATAHLLTRLMKKMQAQNIAAVVPRMQHSDEPMKATPALNLSSTYIIRGAKALPKTTDTAPWKPRVSYFADWWDARFGDVMQGLQTVKPVST